MIEITTKKYIEKSINIPVFLERQNDFNGEYVLIEKTGSSLKNHIQNSTIAVQSYADTLYKAAVLNDKVKKVILNMIELSEVTKVELNSDYNYTDQQTKKYRYQAVFDITHY